MKKELKRIICNRIIELRKKHGLKMEQLALQSGISKGGLSEIERYKKQPQIFTITKICAGLGITLQEFFSYKEINKFTDQL